MRDPSEQEPKRRYQDQEIDYYTKMDHTHQCAVALDAKDFRAFTIHYLCHINNAANEPRTEDSLRDAIVKLTAWRARGVKDTITKLISSGDFERVRNRDNHVRLNPKLYNRFRHDKYLANPYTGNEPKYSDKQSILIAKLDAISSKSHYYSRETREENEENEMTQALLKIDSLQSEVGNLTEKLDKVVEMMQALLTKVSPPEAKEIERHLKLIKCGIEE